MYFDINIKYLLLHFYSAFNLNLPCILTRITLFKDRGNLDLLPKQLRNVSYSRKNSLNNPLLYIFVVLPVLLVIVERTDCRTHLHLTNDGIFKVTIAQV